MALPVFAAAEFPWRITPTPSSATPSRHGAGGILQEATGIGTDGELFNFDFNDESNWVEGQIGGALEIDGVDDYVIAPEYELADDALSLSNWVNANGLVGIPILGGEPALQAGDANMDLKFDQIDLVQVQIGAKYLTGQAATWGEGDWDAAPGGSVGDPPRGDSLFDQVDIIAALSGGFYLTGPYAALAGRGQLGDEQTSIVYDATTGELRVDAPSSTELTSINIDSATGIFNGEAAQNLGGSFDNDSDTNTFKATFGSSFGSLTFGNVAQPGLAEDQLLNDLTVIGSLNGGGDLGPVDLVYIPEPASVVLLCLGLVGLLSYRYRCAA